MKVKKLGTKVSPCMKVILSDAHCRQLLSQIDQLVCYLILVIRNICLLFLLF